MLPTCHTWLALAVAVLSCLINTVLCSGNPHSRIWLSLAHMAKRIVWPMPCTLERSLFLRSQHSWEASCEMELCSVGNLRTNARFCSSFCKWSVIIRSTCLSQSYSRSSSLWLCNSLRQMWLGKSFSEPCTSCRSLWSEHKCMIGRNTQLCEIECYYNSHP